MFNSINYWFSIKLTRLELLIIVNWWLTEWGFGSSPFFSENESDAPIGPFCAVKEQLWLVDDGIAPR